MDKKVRIKFYDPVGKGFAMVTEGKMYEDARGVFIEYDEEGVGTVIGVSRGIVTLTRVKDPGYTIVLEQQTPYSCSLVTDYGEIPVTIMPETVRTRRGRDAIFLTLVYDMHFTETNVLRQRVRLKAEYLDT